MAILIALAGGIFSAAQFLTNGGLASRVGLGKTVLINSILGFAGSFIFYACLSARRGETGWNQAFSFPWHYYIGGFLGASVVAAAAYAMPRLGAAMTVALFVLAQAASAAAFDYLGLMGLSPQPITWLKALGAAFLAAGVFLLRF